MTTLATYKTASGAQIELIKANAPGQIELKVNGKFVGMLDSIKSHDQHGNVITIKGSQSLITIPSDQMHGVEAAIEKMHKIDAEKVTATVAKIAAYAKTDEGKIEALLARIHAHDDDGGRDRSERF